MVDYAAWIKVDPLTVKEAAHLWAGLDPTSLVYGAEAARLAPKLRMLCGAVKRGVLPVDHRKNSLLGPLGYYEESEVSRSDLKAFASSIGERPAFLFYSDPVEPMPATKKLSAAPPPVPTLRGGNAFSSLVSGLTTSAQRAKSKPIPPASRGAAVPIAEDAAVLAKMVKEAFEKGDAFSVRAYVLAHEKEIDGAGTLDSKIRRLQRKFDNMRNHTPD